MVICRDKRVKVKVKFLGKYVRVQLIDINILAGRVIFGPKMAYLGHFWGVFVHGEIFAVDYNLTRL